MATSKVTCANSNAERSGVGKGEVSARFGLYRTENIGRTAAFVFVIAPGFPTGDGRRGGADIGMQSDRLLVQTHHRLFGIEWLFIYSQDVFHFADVGLIEFGHAPHFFPATA
jgi:hypothetical protein